MSLKGGYKIVNFGGMNILSTADPVKIPTVWKNAETDKPVLLSGLVVDGEKIPDTFVAPILKDNNKVFNLAYEADEDSLTVIQLTITPNNYVGVSYVGLSIPEPPTLEDFFEIVDLNDIEDLDDGGTIEGAFDRIKNANKPIMFKNLHFGTFDGVDYEIVGITRTDAYCWGTFAASDNAITQGDTITISVENNDHIIIN